VELAFMAWSRLRAADEEAIEVTPACCETKAKKRLTRRDQINWPRKNPSAGSGVQARGRSETRIGATVYRGAGCRQFWNRLE
jgi:hypothetical protein